MVGMTPEKFLDTLAVDAELFFERKEDADQRERQAAFGIGHGHAAAQFGGMSKELQPKRAALGAPEVPAVEEFFPLSFTGSFQKLGGRKPLDKPPCTERAPVLKSFQRCGVILGQSMPQLANESSALFDQGYFIAT